MQNNFYYYEKKIECCAAYECNNSKKTRDSIKKEDRKLYETIFSKDSFIQTTSCKNKFKLEKYFKGLGSSTSNKYTVFEISLNAKNQFKVKYLAKKK